jgi:uncharacterized membrane protein YeaQ/YmgE (transglycosylase-associated protein family)
MSYVIMVVIGGVLGWLASMVMRTDAQQGILLNVIVGIVGALIGGILLSPMVGSGSIVDGDYSVASLGVSFVGALVLLAVLNLLWRGRVR